MKSEPTFDPSVLIRRTFDEAGIKISQLEERNFPDETIFVVKATPPLEKAISIANEVDRKLADNGFKGFVTVRPAENALAVEATPIRDLSDQRVSTLLTLVSARSRASEYQPSLSYVPNHEEIISLVTSPRHHLIFGRRGAGKTALMVEAKRVIEKRGAISVWVNLQTLRSESGDQAFAWVCRALCDKIAASYINSSVIPHFLSVNSQLRAELEQTTSAGQSLPPSLIPRMQSLLKNFLRTSDLQLFIFLDELHYISRGYQPKLLDRIHGLVRDCNAFLKVAGIKHLSRWFEPSPPTGLQTGQDAELIDLDVTLQNPADAKNFLESVLETYVAHAGIRSLSKVFSNAALDRLVLASGAVPRDYLTLSGNAVRQARKRESSRTVGMQDVNKAAGEALAGKIAELQEDTAPAGRSAAVLESLRIVRDFCVQTKGYTYFRVSFSQKDTKAAFYSYIQDLMDLRLLHLVEPSLSDERRAGQRSEVYLLDLSQYSGQRLKRKLKVLNFESGYLVLKDTGTTKESRVGRTPHQRLGILRRAPLFDLQLLAEAERDEPNAA